MKENLKKIFSAYNLLFAVVLGLIFLVIIINKNANTSLSSRQINDFPWNKRSVYIKQLELLSKLKHISLNDENVLTYINQLILISKNLEDNKTLEYAHDLKIKYLLSHIKQLLEDSKNYEYIDDLSFNEKVSLYLLTKDERLMNYIIEKSNEFEKIKFSKILEVLTEH
ncbi:hypothetical protein XO10_09000 [Marinitoga sp. 1135]|uniref:Uncharacterized protein n=1 Tax=Marinitoga piezophila (strain DSM 14283 / JCM 11233 / KA3) TaxID=443254 RepID=H2J5Y5_MARPK|nr:MULTISPECIES: hypothetical protein [Marinitoga]AEX86204.1 hypothetical protein Marpi_1823 [Marinitoga piezophila KA3]APT76617.1 hypothetical protein LN42_09680 [Marinitoga sp. 1137]NUU96392.1 hypothetical protein [Marinitoga sp. 1135]NUU98314.1 hypothetical protein [Marinitoga sp. 1138]